MFLSNEMGSITEMVTTTLSILDPIKNSGISRPTKDTVTDSTMNVYMYIRDTRNGLT